MYYVPDGTKECGYYECKKCGSRFLSLQTMNTIPCPDCGMDIDYEIGPDETLEAAEDTAVLVEKITGEYVGLLRYQRPFDESRLHRCDCFPEKRLPFQNRHNWGKEAGGLDCGGGTA